MKGKYLLDLVTSGTMDFDSVTPFFYILGDDFDIDTLHVDDPSIHRVAIWLWPDQCGRHWSLSVYALEMQRLLLSIRPIDPRSSRFQ